MSIEEARLRLHNVADQSEMYHSIMDAADAYALAVLDASAGPADSDHGGLDYNDALRTQIKALGAAHPEPSSVPGGEEVV